MKIRIVLMLFIALFSFTGISTTTAQSVNATTSTTVHEGRDNGAKAYYGNGPRWGRRGHHQRRGGKMANHRRHAPRHRPNGHRARGDHR